MAPIRRVKLCDRPSPTLPLQAAQMRFVQNVKLAFFPPATT